VIPLADQMAHFARSSIIVGTHGAGLANILFRRGAPMALVEMINRTKKDRHHFFQISTHCGFFYRATLNNSEQGDEQIASACADIDAVIVAVEESIEWESSEYDRLSAQPDDGFLLARTGLSEGCTRRSPIV
jgi:capsular polysaccharide biosynthesis protein